MRLNVSSDEPTGGDGPPDDPPASTNGDGGGKPNAEQSSGEPESGEQSPDRDRRRLLLYGGLAALGASGAVGAWYTSQDADTPPTTAGSMSKTTTTETTETTADTTSEQPAAVPAVVRRYAPDLYFGALEKWFPTDPRPYVVPREGQQVVDGFTALDAYTAEYGRTGSPPAPMVFYNVVEAAPGIDAIQYWMYSVFDQFTVNFHWHDWELLQVFVDSETETPLLLSASAHARTVPNNEFLDPDLSGNRRPGLLAEVGSHSSASELNARTPTFERFPGNDWTADVTNDTIEIVDTLTTPFAYGLPRDEGARLPFVMPELDGHALSDHPGLDVDATAFIDKTATVTNWQGLPAPPTDIPLRQPGLVLTHADSLTTGNATYELASMAAVRDAVDDFVGPQLSFEFTIPDFLEDLAASHLTSVGIPWTQARYTDPLADVTSPKHRQAIDGTAPSGLSDRVVGRFRHVQTGTEGALDAVADGAKDALGSLAAVSLFSPVVELAVRLASPDPTATVTRNGVFTYLHVERGDHLLVANGPGYAPVAARFTHEGGTYRAGTRGNLSVVANEDAAWIRGDGRPTNGISHVRVTEEYAGPIYDDRPPGDNRFAIAVHADGTYTVDVRDADGVAGSFPLSSKDFDDGEFVIRGIETGKYSVTRTLVADIETLRSLGRRFADRDDAQGQYLERLSLALDEAEVALAHAERGDTDSANDRLVRTVDRLIQSFDALRAVDQDGYTDASVAVLDPKTVAAIRRAELAFGTPITA